MAIKDDILQDALKSEVRPKKSTLYSRMKLLEPIDVNSLDNWQQSDNEPETNSKQTGDTTDNTTENKAITNRQQSDNKLTTKTSFFSLVGLQRAILLAVYQVCKISRSHTTDPLTLEFIAAQVKTDTKSTKTTLQRLEKKGCIIRVAFKNGRGGWTKYKIPDYLYNEMLNLETVNKLTTNWQQSSNKVVTQPATEPTTTTSSSSRSSINDKNTTTSEDQQTLKLLEEWSSIDLEPLTEFGFTQTHIMQIAKQGKLEQALVQNSIYAFAFDLKRNDKQKTLKTNPVNYFMGILRNGQPYAPPSNYESPQDEALRLYVEKQRELEQRREALANDALELAFKEWLQTLTDAEKSQLLPHSLRNFKAEQPKIAMLKEHFINEIWNQKRLEIMQVSD